MIVDLGASACSVSRLLQSFVGLVLVWDGEKVSRNAVMGVKLENERSQKARILQKFISLMARATQRESDRYPESNIEPEASGFNRRKQESEVSIFRKDESSSQTTISYISSSSRSIDDKLKSRNHRYKYGRKVRYNLEESNKQGRGRRGNKYTVRGFYRDIVSESAPIIRVRTSSLESLPQTQSESPYPRDPLTVRFPLSGL